MKENNQLPTSAYNNNNTRLDKLGNDTIKNRIDAMSWIEKLQIQWFGHLMRMKRNQLPTSAYNKK